jgi:6-phosphofructokinase 1
VTLDEVASLLVGAILKRQIMGRQDGLAIIAEGIGELLDPEELAAIPGVEVSHDPHGHIRLGEIPLATILRREVQRRLAELHQERTMVELSLGYELRSAPPIPFDIDYTRTLGYGAVNFLLSGSNEGREDHGAMVYLEKGNLATLPLENLRGSDGRTRIRLVDTNSQTYEVARKYMLRLERTDLENPDTLAKLAEAAHLTPVEIEERFGPVVGLGAKQA